MAPLWRLARLYGALRVSMAPSSARSRTPFASVLSSRLSFACPVLSSHDPLVRVSLHFQLTIHTYIYTYICSLIYILTHHFRFASASAQRLGIARRNSLDLLTTSHYLERLYLGIYCIETCATLASLDPLFCHLAFLSLS